MGRSPSRLPSSRQIEVRSRLPGYPGYRAGSLPIYTAIDNLERDLSFVTGTKI